MEVVKLLVKLAEETCNTLRAYGFNDYLIIKKFDDRISIWKFLINNFSIDAARKTIDYDSMFRTSR